MEDLSAIIPPYQHLRNIFLVAPNYRLATCQIEKNMATIRASIFCYLTNTKDVLKKNLTITKMFWDNTVCDYTYVRRNISDTISSVGQNMTLFTVLRHPIDRFLSGYVDKCYNELTYFNEEERCFGCKYDMGCFLEKLQTLFLHNVRMTVDWKNPIYQHYLRHFAPQTWYCEFKKHKSKYVFVHYNNGPNGTEGIADDFDKIFEQAQIPRDIRSTIHREMMKGATKHSTANSILRKTAEHQLLSDDYLMRLFMHLYYYDFVEFGFN